MLISIIAYNHPQRNQNYMGLIKHSLVLKITGGSEKFHIHFPSETMCYLFFLVMVFYIAFQDQNVISTITFSDVLQGKITSFFPLKGFRWNNICVEIIVNMLNWQQVSKGHCSLMFVHKIKTWNIFFNPFWII